MKFEAERKETILLNPREDMARTAIPSEIRTDPLTGRTARICHFMQLKWEKPDFDEMVARGGKFCPFCPENVLKVTPCFPEEIVPEGRMIRGDMVLFPNLAPYDSLGAVATLGSARDVTGPELGVLVLLPLAVVELVGPLALPVLWNRTDHRPRLGSYASRWLVYGRLHGQTRSVHSAR